MIILIKCPFCSSNIEIHSPEEYQTIYYHPKVPHPQILGKWGFWSFERPDGTTYITKKCPFCEKEVEVEFFPKEEECPKGLKEVLDFLDGKGSLQIPKPWLERVIEFISKKLKIGDFKSALVLCSIPSLFMFFVSVACHGLSKYFHDWGSFIGSFVYNPCYFIIFNHNLRSVRELSVKTLFLDLSEEYTKTRSGKLFEVEYLQGNILGQPGRITSPTRSGIVVTIIYLLWWFFYLIRKISLGYSFTLFETPYPGHGYPKYESIVMEVSWRILPIPFGFFVLSNVLWISLSFAVLIGTLARKIPLKINPLEKYGGIEDFGKMMVRVILPVGVTSINCVTTYMWAVWMEERILILTSILANIFFIILTFIIFFAPLYPIHVKMSKIKKETSRRIMNEISSLFPMKKERITEPNELLRLLVLQNFHQTVSEMNTWPFDIDTLLQAIGTILIPAISHLCRIIFESIIE